MASRAWDINVFEGETAETIDTGGRLAEGWYLATLAETSDNQQNGSKELTFAVKGGPYSGMKAKKDLWNPQFSDTPDKAKQAMQHAKAWAYRLGLLTEEQFKAPKTYAINWDGAVGKVYVIEVKTRKYTKKDGTQGEVTEVGYLGCYPLDHPDIPEDTRKELAIGPARALRPGEKRRGHPAPTGTGAGAGAANTTAAGSTTPAATQQQVDSLAANLWGNK